MRRWIVLMAAAALLALTACGGTSADEAEAPEIVGSEAPEFMLDNALGGQTALSNYAGEPVLLYFHMAVG